MFEVISVWKGVFAQVFFFHNSRGDPGDDQAYKISIDCNEYLRFDFILRIPGEWGPGDI